MVRSNLARYALVVATVVTVLANSPVAVGTAESERTTFERVAPYDDAYFYATAMSSKETGAMAAISAPAEGCLSPFCFDRKAGILEFLELDRGATDVEIEADILVSNTGSLESSPYITVTASHMGCGECNATTSATLPIGQDAIRLELTVFNGRGGLVPPGTIMIVTVLTVPVWAPLFTSSCTPCPSVATSASAVLERIGGSIGPDEFTRGIQLSPANQTRHVSPGEAVVFEVNLQNQGTLREHVMLHLAGERSGWSTSVSPSSVRLMPGETVTARVTVQAAGPGSLTTTLTATAADGAVSDTASLRTIAHR